MLISYDKVKGMIAKEQNTESLVRRRGEGGRVNTLNLADLENNCVRISNSKKILMDLQILQTWWITAFFYYDIILDALYTVHLYIQKNFLMI